MSVIDARGHLGVGLFTMQSTAAAPTSPQLAYREFAAAAALVEAHGLHSVWTAEHRAWYDGWCPAPLHAQAFAAAATSRVRFGSAMLLLPQHDPVALARSVTTLDRLYPGRVELGVGLGYRDAEFDALGLARPRRGRLMDEALDVLDAAWSVAHGKEPPPQRPVPRLWIGGMAPTAIRRAARRGHSLMLPQTLRPEELSATVAAYRAEAPGERAIGVMRDVWIETDPGRGAALRRAIERHYREEAGSWWVLKGSLGFAAAEQLERQLGRIEESALVGPPEYVAAGVDALFEAGADLIAARLNFDFVPAAALHEQIARLADEVAPLLRPRRAMP